MNSLSSELIPPSGTRVTGIEPLEGGSAGLLAGPGGGGVYKGGAVVVDVIRGFLCPHPAAIIAAISSPVNQ